MASNFDYTKYDVTPDEATKLRQQAYEKFQRVSEPALKEQVGQERGDLAQQAYEAGMRAARTGNVQGNSQVAGQVAAKAAELMPQQFGREDTMLQQGAQMKGDIAAGKSGTQISRYNRNTEETKNKLADYLAEKKLQQGMTSKQLSLAANGYLADRGMRILKSDFDKGRVTDTELRRMQNGLTFDLASMQKRLEADKARWDAELEIALKERDVAKTKELMQKRIDAELDMIKTKAKSASIGSILSGATQGAGIGATFGPWGAVIGGAAGAASGVAIPNLMNDYESGGPGVDTILTGGILDF